MGLFAPQPNRAKANPPDSRPGRAAAHSARVAQRSRTQFAAKAEVGPPGPPADKRRRAACGRSLANFLSTYFPHSTGLSPFSPDHKPLLREMEYSMRHGGRRVNAVYRGFAKTTITENAALWAVLYGHRKYVVVLAINQTASVASIESIKSELATNDLLAADFPEVCKYVAALEGKPQRAPHQTCEGRPTRMTWRADVVVLPTVAGSRASGAIITAKPFRKARGLKFKRPDGEQARPDLVILDDPQDDESAVSRTGVEKNLAILRRAILQTAGHRKKLAVVVNATIIARGDMIDQLLADPAWQGRRVPMIGRWANAHETLWLIDYAALRREFDRAVPADQARAHAAATRFYKKHRKAMDAGCRVSWKHCHGPDEVSAIQHAYNILIDDGDETFASEYQQEPVEPGEHGPLRLVAAQIAAKTNGLDRGVLPLACQHVTAYVDVHDRLLYFVVAAWSDDFGGAVIDYGTYPKQRLRYFAQATAPVTMAKVHPGLAEDARLVAGLAALVQTLLAAGYAREDGVTMRIGRLLVDAKWGQKTELVKKFCRRHAQSGSIVLPAMGMGFGPTRKTFAEYKPEPGAKIGLAWRLAKQQSGDRVVSIDVNWWKSFAAERLGMAAGTPGAWDLFGRQPGEHALFADHCVAEVPKTLVHKESARERVVWEWKPGRPDNHWWDCLVGSAVAGSMLGVRPAGLEPTKRRRRRQVRYS